MNVVGKVIDINMSRNITKQGGGTYKGATLTYRDSKDGSIKEKHFHENALKFNPSLKSQLSGLVKDTDFTMVIEKEGEFWNVKSISNGVVQSTSATQGSSPSGSNGGGATSSAASSPKSTYQTAEERAQTQIYIVRQSTLTQAINFLNCTSPKGYTLEAVLEIAKRFEDHVLAPKLEDNSIENMENDIPY